MLAILTYHGLDDSGAITSTPPRRFAAHMRFFADAGYRLLTLDEVAAHLTARQPFPERSAALTFDDAYRSVRTVALPELRRYAFPATTFVVSGHCGGTNDWPTEAPSIPRRALLDSEELRELHAAGITLGAHSANHPHLCALPRAEALGEIDESRHFLEDLIQSPVRHFAFPYGESDRELRSSVAEKFASACGTDLRPVAAGDDLFDLPRIDAYYLDRVLALGGPHTAPARCYLRGRRTLRRLWRRLRAASN